MSYGKVKDTFWTDKKIRSLSDDAKMLALYFLTGPHRNILGCMRVPNGYLMEDLGWPERRLSDAIRMLCGCQFIARDMDGWTMILNQLKHDPIKVPNHAKAAVVIADTVPSDSVVYQYLVPKLTTALDAIGMASAWHPHEIAIPIPSPLPEPEPEPSQKESNGHFLVENDSQLSLIVPSTKKRKADEGFDEFWETYGKKVDKANSLKAYRRALAKPGVTPEILISNAKRYRAEKTGVEIQFIRHPATWLNGECWNDEPQPEILNGGNHRASRPEFTDGWAELAAETARNEK